MKFFKSKCLSILFMMCVSPLLYAEKIPEPTKVQVCKAAISSIMGVEPETIKTSEKKDGTIYLYYQLDGKWSRYDYKCKLEGDKVIWGTALARWRTHDDDSVITFSVKNAQLIIKESFPDEPESEAIKTAFDMTQL